MAGQQPTALAAPSAGSADGADAGRVTISEVARRAGVSKQTVSNVLNNPERVTAVTADRVQRVIDALNYRPSRFARQLRTRRSGVLAMRMEFAESDLVFNRFLHDVSAAAALVEHRIMLYTAADDQSEIAEFDELIGERNIDGFIVTASHRGDAREEYLIRAGAPFVSFGRPWDAGVDCNWVDVDGAAGCFMAVRHLVDLGHRRIAFLGWPSGSGVGDDRLAGWRRAMTEARLAVPEPLRVDNDISASRAASAELLARPAADRPTAVVCASDTLAIGVQTEAAAAGMTVGTDLSIVGFDDSAMAQAAGLTSLAQPVGHVAAEAVRLLVGLISAAAAPPHEHILLTPTLVVRGSTGPPAVY